MYEVGDTYTQTFTLKDVNGVLTTPSPYTASITLPDATTVTPTTTVVSTGVIRVDYYPITQLGNYSLSISGTLGVYPFAQGDTFNVSTSVYFPVSLADARLAIGFPGDTSKDESLRTVMAGAMPVLEDLIGSIVPTTRTGTYDGGRVQIALLHAPVMSITSIIESSGSNYVRTLTAQDIFSGSGSGDSFGYSVDLGSGIITRRASGVAINFLPGVRNIQVIYVSGRTLKGNQILAARRLIRHLWQTEQQGFRPAFGTPDTAMGLTPSGFAVPKAVIELCAGDLRIPGIG